jgi:hypothetical protein
VVAAPELERDDERPIAAVRPLEHSVRAPGVRRAGTATTQLSASAA